MFSANSFINLLFAYPDDTYYTESLTRFTDLNKYIWYLLHKQESCDVVYFLNYDHTGIKVSGFGEKNFVPFDPKRGLFTTTATKVKDWMRDTLKSKSRKCAIVCPLKEFATLLESQEYAGLLKELLKLGGLSSGRTGFFLLTASPYVEDSKDLLLTCKAFAEHDTEDGRRCLSRPILNLRYETKDSAWENIYDVLAQQMEGACVFLDRFDAPAVRGIVNQLFLSQEVRNVDPEEMTRLLCDMFHSEEFYIGQIFQSFFESVPMKRKDLYNKLRSFSCEQISALRGICRSAPRKPWNRTPMFFQNDVIRQCLKLRWPEGITACPEGKDLLYAMKRSLFRVPNQKVNPEILRLLEGAYNRYLERFTSSVNEDEHLRCFLFEILGAYARWLYLPEKAAEEGELLKLADYVDKYLIGYSSYVNELNTPQSVLHQDYDAVAAGLYECTLAQNKLSLQQRKEQLDSFQVLLRTSFKNLETPKQTFSDIQACFDALSSKPEEGKKANPADRFFSDAPLPISFDIIPKPSHRAPKFDKD